MSSLIQRLTRRLAGLSLVRCAPFDPDSMSLREWADLPIHHPLRDSAPR